MDTSTLLEKQIQEGKSIIVKLDQSGLLIEAAFWLYDSERRSSWKLFIASSSLELDLKKDTFEAYGKVDGVIRTIPNLSFVSLSDIEIIPLDHPYIENIAPLIATGPGIVDMSFTNTRFNDVYIEGLYLYRMNVKTTK